MKYLIASEGSTLEDVVSPHFGRAPFFLIYDDVAKTLETKTNDGSLDPHMVIHDSAKLGVQKMICGGIGPNAFKVAAKFKVQVCLTSGIPVKEAINLAAEGKLPVTMAPTMGHHHHEHGSHHNTSN
jgi:predicted Fe-Mo cluster-binding NifX family protein